MYKDPTIVLTVGRSGSSAVAGQMYYLGFHMGNKFVPADSNNPAGHWEDKELKRLNLAVMAGEDNGGISKEKFLDKAEMQMNARATEYDFWGWKVPSTATVIDGYLKVLKDANIIWCRRPKKDVVDSMVSAYGWDKKDAEKLHDERREKIEQVVKNHDHLLLDFKDIVGDPEGTVERIIDYTGIKPLKEKKSRAVAHITQNKPDSDTKVLIALHNGGWVRKEICYNAIKWTADNRYKTTFTLPQYKPYSKNVNITIQKEFLPNDFDFLLIVDADNPPQKSPLDLIELNKAVIGLPTPQWSGDIIYPTVMDKVGGDDWKSLTPNRHQSLQEVDAVGSGCVLIRRDVIEAVNDDNKGPVWNDVWKEEGTERTTGDYNFCKRAKEQGYRVWAHFDYSCDHIKEIPLRDMLEYKKR